MSQINYIFFGPEPMTRMKYYQINLATVEAGLARGDYSKQDLLNWVLLFKWLLQTWRTDPELFASLPAQITADIPALTPLPKEGPERQQGSKDRILAGKQWLEQAMIHRYDLPDAFVTRDINPSDIFSGTGRGFMNILRDLGYVEEDERPSKSGSGRGQSLFYISKMAQKELARMHKVSIGDIHRSEKGSFNNDHKWNHTEGTVKFRMIMDRDAKRLGYRVTWQTQREVEQVHQHYKVELLRNPSNPKSMKKEGVYPDSRFVLQTPKNRYFGFLEYDRSTETINAGALGGQFNEDDTTFIVWKVRKWGEFFKRHYKTVYSEAEVEDTKNPQIKYLLGRIYFVTYSATRLKNIAEAIQTCAGQAANRYYLTLDHWLAPSYHTYWEREQTILNGTIWQSADQLGVLKRMTTYESDG